MGRRLRGGWPRQSEAITGERPGCIAISARRGTERVREDKRASVQCRGLGYDPPSSSNSTGASCPASGPKRLSRSHLSAMLRQLRSPMPSDSDEHRPLAQSETLRYSGAGGYRITAQQRAATLCEQLLPGTLSSTSPYRQLRCYYDFTTRPKPTRTSFHQYILLPSSSPMSRQVLVQIASISSSLPRAASTTHCKSHRAMTIAQCKPSPYTFFQLGRSFTASQNAASLLWRSVGSTPVTGIPARRRASATENSRERLKLSPT